MKAPLITFTLLSLLIIIDACRPSNPKTTDDDVEEIKTDLSGITYYDLLTQVFEDDGFSYTWDGNSLPNDFIASLSITKEGECGSRGCGELLSITNNSTADTLEVIVKGAYDLEGDAGQITRQYVIPANGKVAIGCSHLCIEGKSFAFEREIIGSSIFEEAPL